MNKHLRNGWYLGMNNMYKLTVGCVKEGGKHLRNGWYLGMNNMYKLTVGCVKEGGRYEYVTRFAKRDLFDKIIILIKRN